MIAPIETVSFQHAHPPLPPEKVAMAATRAFVLPFRHARLHKRAFHDTYVLTDAQGAAFFLRLYRPGYWPDNEIAAEMHILRSLKAAGYPVAAPAALPGDVQRRISLAERAYQAALFPGLAGTAAPMTEPDTAKSLAAALARLHRQMDGLPTRRRYRLDGDGLAAFILPTLQAILPPAGVARLHACLSACLEALAAIPAEKPFFGLCHGDPHGGNWLLWRDEVRFLDFDHCGHMWRIHDLAVALWDAASFCGRCNVAALSAALIDGYETARPLLAAEKAALIPACALRHLWWAALHIRMGRNEEAFAAAAVERAEQWLKAAKALP